MSAPMVVHRPSPRGGRQVTVRLHDRDEVLLGTAYSDHSLVVLREAAGFDDPDRIIDDPKCVEWRGVDAHRWDAV
ncbi:hypothetical protein [Streptomyces xantholiticus]|uniref:Uncharacterized protein n=1 Tax=Streptomyces xantholiticus TaxID=68285 RepID=A0ABV1V3B4_9ACTN